MKVFVVKQHLSSEIPQGNNESWQQHNCIQHPTNMAKMAEYADLDTYFKRGLRTLVNVIVGKGYRLGNPSKPVEDFLKRSNLNAINRKFYYDYLTMGNGFLLLDRVGRQPYRFYHKQAIDTYISRDFQRYWQLTADWQEKEFGAWGGENAADLQEILSLKQYKQGNAYYGYPDVSKSAYLAMELSYQAKKGNLKIFHNGAVPDLAIIAEGHQFTVDEENQIVSALRSVKGVDEMHKTIFLSMPNMQGKFKIEKLGEYKDMDFKNLNESCRDEVVSAIGVPQTIMNILVGGKLGSSSDDEGKLLTWLEVDIRPRQQELVDFYTEFFVTEFNHDPELAFNEIDITTFAKDVAAAALLIQWGVQTPEQIAQRLGMEYNAPAPENTLEKSLETIIQKWENS